MDVSDDALEGSVGVACGHRCRACDVRVPNEGVVREPGVGEARTVFESPSKERLCMF